MNKTSFTTPMKTQSFLALLSLLAALQVHAGPGHDHGDEAPRASAIAQPRFAASSELFELVGVLEGKTLRLYLDRAATNEPLPQADIELEFGGVKLAPQAQADGSFAVELAQAPGDGVHALTASVTVGDEADLLAGELDLHGEAAQETHAHWGWKRWSLLAAGCLLGLSVLVFFWRRQRAQSFGAAA
jgi:hypothetical protein